jgi:hypothetical protein
MIAIPGAARSALVALLLGGLVGCAGGPDAAALQKDVESALQAKDFAGAVTKADAALQAETIAKDPAKSWRFESLKLEALADGGKGPEVVAGLTRLATTYDKQLTAATYRELADKLRASGNSVGANDVLVLGDKRFPTDPSFKEAIKALNTEGDPAEVERLKALGYLN